MDTDARDVALRIPAQPGYLVLARLALSAVCRLTELEAEDVQDLKLAVNEAATDFISGSGDPEGTVAFTFRVDDDRLILELGGSDAGQDPSDQEQSRAIVLATVDEAEFEPGRTILVKRLPEAA